MGFVITGTLQLISYLRFPRKCINTAKVNTGSTLSGIADVKMILSWQVGTLYWNTVGFCTLPITRPDLGVRDLNLKLSEPHGGYQICFRTSEKRIAQEVKWVPGVSELQHVCRPLM